MQFLSSLFGGSGNTILTMIFALGVVIVLILIVVWLLKLAFKVSGNSARGRNRRLSVIDTMVIDQKRQLMIIRRDNVEHLILTGGPQDLVVETGIPVVEEAVSPVGRRPPPNAVPMVRRPAPANAAPAVEAVRPVPPQPKREPETLLDQLQQAGHSGERKQRVSLRQTGLLRPQASVEANAEGQNPDITDGRRIDSGNESNKGDTSEGAAFEHRSGNDIHRG